MQLICRRKKQLMHRIYQNFLLLIVISLSSLAAVAQNDTVPPPASVNPELLSIFENKSPKEYIISDIKVNGAKSFDKNLIVSISGLQIGDKVQLPGSDIFGKAINKLWNQNL